MRSGILLIFMVAAGGVPVAAQMLDSIRNVRSGELMDQLFATALATYRYEQVSTPKGEVHESSLALERAVQFYKKNRPNAGEEPNIQLFTLARLESITAVAQQMRAVKVVLEIQADRERWYPEAPHARCHGKHCVCAPEAVPAGN